jgi:hypothetical protein
MLMTSQAPADRLPWNYRDALIDLGSVAAV